MTTAPDPNGRTRPVPLAGLRWQIGSLSYSLGGLILLFGYLLLGDFAWSLKERSVQDLFKVMLREQSQHALLLNILVGVLPAFLSLVVGPAIGAWSDRTRTRWGRRVPFLAASAPIIGLSVVGLAYSEPIGYGLAASLGLAPQWQSIAAIVSMTVFWIFYECGTVVGTAMFTALINDTMPHHLIGRFFGVFRFFSLAVGAGFFYFFFDNGLGDLLRPILLAVAAVYVVCFLSVAIGIKEGTYPALVPRPANESPFGIVACLGGGRTRDYYISLFSVFSLAMACFVPVNINAYNAIGQFGLDKSGFGLAMALTYVVSMGLAYPIGWLADRFHPVRVGLCALFLYCVLMLAAGRLMHDGTSFTISFVAHGVLSGIFYTGTASIMMRLLPKENFSQLAAVSTALVALMTALVALLTGAILDLAGHDFKLIFFVGGATAGLAALGGAWSWVRFDKCGKITATAPASREAAAPCAVGACPQTPPISPLRQGGGRRA
jgi:maltose/moltooligosaccharide transporter